MHELGVILVFQTRHVDHNDHPEITKLEMVSRCKHRATTESTHLRQIFDEESARVPDAAAARVGYGQVVSSLQKRRRKEMPAEPRSVGEVSSHLQDFVLSKMPDGSNFFRGEVGNGDERAILFASDHQLQALSSTTNVNADGTFKVVPRFYKQLFGIYVIKEGHCFPLVFTLMTHKSAKLYTAVFEEIKRLVPGFSPQQMQADFEEASAIAFQAVFGEDVLVIGCFFHYAQAILRRVGQEGLLVRFLNEDDFKSFVLQLMALPLLPANLIEEGVNILAENSDAGAQRMIQYVRSYWISRVGVNRLSVNGQVNRTNNGVESYHSNLRRLTPHDHPSVYILTEILQKEATKCPTEMTRLAAGHTLTHKKKVKYVLNDNRIRQQCRLLDQNQVTVRQFLRHTRHTMEGYAVPAIPAPVADEIPSTPAAPATVHSDDLPDLIDDVTNRSAVILEGKYHTRVKTFTPC